MSAYRADANPFDDPGSNPFSQSNNSAFSLDDVGGGNSAPSGGIANMSAYVADHDRRARDLEAKQRELEERERNLSAREAEVEQYKANWPPFMPLIVHDIKFVPTEHQRNARLMYFYWLELAATLVFNLLGCLFLWISGAMGGFSSFISSIFYLVFILLLSFVLWYYPVYNGWRRINKRGAAILFYCYFIFGGIHIIYCLYMAIGAPYTGSSGLVNTIRLLIGEHNVSGIIGIVFGIIACVGWIVQLLGGLVLYKLVWAFKNSNAEINWANAKTEFTGLKTIFKLFKGSST